MSETKEIKRTEQEALREERDVPVFAPAADITEQSDAFELVADMPGVDEQHITIDLEDDVLTVRGQALAAADLDEKRLVYSEFATGDYRRVFRIGRKIDREGIRAGVKNGVLRIRLPKAKEARARRIPVEAAS